MDMKSDGKLRVVKNMSVPANIFDPIGCAQIQTKNVPELIRGNSDHTSSLAPREKFWHEIHRYAFIR
jgi:hypothetical protein